MGALGWLSLRLPWALQLGRAGPRVADAGWGTCLCRTGRKVAVPPRARWHRGTEPAEQAGLQKWLNKPCKSELRKELPTEKAILEDKCNLRI